MADFFPSLNFFITNSTGEILWTILSITLIDLILSGDNAAILSLAVQGLPVNIREKAITFGITIGIILQVIFTLMATWLMTIPYLTALGGISLLIITAKLLTNHDYDTTMHHNSSKQEKSFGEAILFIILANLSMSFDNVLGVAGTAGGNYLLVCLSLVLSIPLLILGTNWIGHLIMVFPPVIFLGGGILIHSAIAMIFTDTALGLSKWIAPISPSFLGWIIGLSFIIYGSTKKALPRPPKQKRNKTKL